LDTLLRIEITYPDHQEIQMPDFLSSKVVLDENGEEEALLRECQGNRYWTE